MRQHQILATALTVALAAAPLLPMAAFAEETTSGKTLNGVIKIDKNQTSSPTINENDIKTVNPGATLDMVISTGVTTGVSTTGDEFFGKVSKDYTVDGKVVIPRDTLVHGIVETIADPKRAGRNGYIRTRFDYMITPDGREIAIEGGNSTRDGKGKAAAKVVGRAAGFTAVGGVMGAIMVLKYGGMAAVAATNGYALAGGAAVGGVAGLTAAMIKKGHAAMIQPGAELRIKLTDELVLPTVNMPDASAEDYTLEGLNVKVMGMRYDKDPFGEDSEVTVSMDVTNKTEYTFSTFEVALEDEYGNVFFPSPFGDTGMWFGKLAPNTHQAGNVTFSVDNPHLHHKLVFYKQYTREPLAKFALLDSMLPVDKKGSKKMSKTGKNKTVSDF